jgi:recombination protein RecT
MANEGIIKKTTGEITARQGKPKTLNDYIKAMEPAIKKALPSIITPERFTRMTLTAVRSTPGLAACEPKSFLAAMMSAAQLGLEPNTPLGQAYLIPFRNNKKGITEVQFQIGYKGLIDLAYRSGEVEVVQAQCVYENDKFECEYGIEPKLRHVPADGERGKLIKIYAMFRTKSGGYGFEVMSIKDIEDHAKKYSKSYNSSSSPWKSNFEEMAKKTVLKRVLKYAPLKSDFVRSVVQDETVKTDLSEDMYEVPAEQIDYVDVECKEPVIDKQTGEVIEEG